MPCRNRSIERITVFPAQDASFLTQSYKDGIRGQSVQNLITGITGFFNCANNST